MVRKLDAKAGTNSTRRSRRQESIMKGRDLLKRADLLVATGNTNEAAALLYDESDTALQRGISVTRGK